MVQYSVYITVAEVGISCDELVERAARRGADGTGCCLFSGDRDFDWQELTKRQAIALQKRVHETLVPKGFKIVSSRIRRETEDDEDEVKTTYST